MSKEPDLFEAKAADIEQSSVSDQVEQAYIDYAMSVIGGRALPDARDGLKPVQRRVLYKMHELGVTSNTSHRKSSSIIGETMGDLHPHGDKAIYDSLVRMSQDFSLGVPLVDGQGNFGSMDGDPPAAMRYTEARMSPLSEDMISDIDKDTVDFKPNYDNRLEEPEVLPSALPNLLINGASGIAVGMTTDIQPHNVGEVIDATIHRMQNPNCSVSDLMKYVHGPDFPTGATIVGREGIKNAYETGKGRVTVRADYDVEYDENRIVITEIPYQRKKSRIVEKIADNVKDGTLDGVSDVRDESDREGVRIVIDLKSKANIDIVENTLIENVIEDTITMNHIALVNGQPQKLDLPSILDQYIHHRREVIRRRSRYELDEAQDRLHIVKGRLKALGNIEDVVDTIRNSDDSNDAVSQLEEEYDFTEEQAKHITRMRLSSITGMKREELSDEKEELEEEIEKLEVILNNSSALDQEIINELEEMKDKHDHDRRTSIKEDYESVDNEDLIPQEDIVLVITEDNYVKRMPVSTFETQNRGGRGIYGLYDDDDSIKHISVHNTHDTILMLSEQGDVHELKGYQIPESSRQAHGTNIVNILGVDVDEEIQAITQKPDDLENKYLTITTRNGKVKRTELEEFEDIWNPGLKAIDIPEDDDIVNAHITDGDDEIMIATKEGKAIRFEASDVRPTGRSAYGVIGIEVNDEDDVVDSTVVNNNEQEILVGTEDGHGKRTNVSEFSTQTRGGKGVMIIRKDTDIISFDQIDDEPNGSIFITSRDGKIIRVNVQDISRYGRTANGVILMNMEENDVVTAMSCCYYN
jgi:DNA gyrase subunit A